MYYLLAFVKNSFVGDKLSHLCGSSGTWSVDSANRRTNTQKAEIMKGRNKAVEEVWMIPKSRYTQKACEMGVAEFYEYVKVNGIKLA